MVNLQAICYPNLIKKRHFYDKIKSDLFGQLKFPKVLLCSFISLLNIFVANLVKTNRVVLSPVLNTDIL